MKRLNPSNKPGSECYSPFGKNIQELLGGIRYKNCSPGMFKNNYLGIMQLFFDRMISHPASSSSALKKRKATMEKLIVGGIVCVGGFYRRIDRKDKVRKMILPHSEEIIGLGDNVLARGGHLNGDEERVFEFGHSMPKYIKKVDLIVPVASEGFEPALLLADIYGTSTIFPIRYSHFKMDDKEPVIPSIYSPEDCNKIIKKKRVVVVEGSTGSGTSIGEVAKFVSDRNPKSLELVIVNGFLPKNYKDIYMDEKKHRTRYAPYVKGGPEVVGVA